MFQPRLSNCRYSQVSLKQRRIPCRSRGAWCASLAGAFDVWVAARAKLLIPAERRLIWASALLRWNNLLSFRDVSVPQRRAKELISSLICSRKSARCPFLRWTSKGSMKEKRGTAALEQNLLNVQEEDYINVYSKKKLKVTR